MALKMEVYSPSLELLGILEVFSSIIWEEQAFKAGTFQLDSLVSDETTRLLQVDHIIWIDDDCAGVIESFELTTEDEDAGPRITVQGRTLVSILERRILWGVYNMTGTPAAIMHRLVSECAVSPTRGDIAAARVIPNLVLAEAPSGGTSIRKQKTGGSLLDALSEIGEAYQVAFGIRFNAQIPRMEFWTRYGADRSIDQADEESVYYSTELDDVLSANYTCDTGDYRNTALVAGAGEGNARKFAVVTSAETVGSTGISRRELWVDARDLQQEDSESGATMTDAEYTRVLANRGMEKLASAALAQSFDATVRPVNATYEYGVDYFLGDTITVTDERLGVTANVVVTARERSEGLDGSDTRLTFGQPLPTVRELIQRSTT